MGALDAGRGFFGSLMQAKGNEQSAVDAAKSEGEPNANSDQDAR
jgi:hypothetical protein